MTVRPLHLVPQQFRADIGWFAALFFTLVAVVGTVPALYFLALLLEGLHRSLTGEGVAMGGMAIVFALPIFWGFAQALFYIRRLWGRRDTDAFWWQSTLLYNLPLVPATLGWVVSEPAPESAGAVLAVAVGLGLAAAAWRDARRSTGPRATPR